jgi:hypothetical protein
MELRPGKKPDLRTIVTSACLQLLRRLVEIRGFGERQVALALFGVLWANYYGFGQKGLNLYVVSMVPKY